MINKIKRLKFVNIIRELTYTEKDKNFRDIMKFLKINNTKGDYAEFGVYKGETAIIAYKMALKNGLKMRFFLYDSFEGLPNPEKEDAGMSWTKGDYYCSLNSVKNNLLKKKINLDNVVFVKGYYHDSLRNKSHGLNKLAAVHIDCDYYSSTREVLDYIKPFLQEGTIILFDDWFTYNGNKNKGEQKAFYEFIKNNPQLEFTNLPALCMKKMFVVNFK